MLFNKKIQEIQRNLPAVMKRLPGIVKLEGLQFIASNFSAQGFEKKKGSVQKWKPKKQVKGKSNKSQATLVNRGHLRRSWQAESRAESSRVVFQSSLPYAATHNEGLQAGRPPGFTMPQRQMIGDSAALNERVNEKLTREMNKVFT